MCSAPSTAHSGVTSPGAARDPFAGPPPRIGVSSSPSAGSAALPGAHSPTAAGRSPGPPSRPRTRRPPACPRNTGAWPRLSAAAVPTASVRNRGDPAASEQRPEERTGNRQQQFPEGPRGLRVPRGRARRKWAHVPCRTTVYVEGRELSLRLLGSAAGRRWRATGEPAEAAGGSR